MGFNNDSLIVFFILISNLFVLLLLRMEPSKEETPEPMKVEHRLTQEENTDGKNKMRQLLEVLYNFLELKLIYNMPKKKKKS